MVFIHWALPYAKVFRPFRANKGPIKQSPERAKHFSSGYNPGIETEKIKQALKGRNILTQGKTLGSQSQMINKALKGRNSTPGLKEKILNNVKNNHHAAIIDPALYSSYIQY